MPASEQRAANDRRIFRQVVSLVLCASCQESVMLRRGKYLDAPDLEHRHQPGQAAPYRCRQNLYGIGGADDWKKREKEKARKKRWNDLSA